MFKPPRIEDIDVYTWVLLAMIAFLVLMILSLLPCLSSGSMCRV